MESSFYFPYTGDGEIIYIYITLGRRKVVCGGCVLFF